MDADVPRCLERSGLSEAQLGDASLNVLFTMFRSSAGMPLHRPSPPGSPLCGCWLANACS
jgi:hypothetical protein